MTTAEAARRHVVADAAMAKWWDRFVGTGKAGLGDGIPGPGSAQAIAGAAVRVAAA
jgi:hypothetical protein